MPFPYAQKGHLGLQDLMAIRAAARGPAWRGVELPFYGGEWDADAIEEWVTKMDVFFEMCGATLTEEEKLSCAAYHLSGNAHKWWRYMKKKQQPKNVRSWKELKTELVRFFMPLKNHNHVLRQFDSLKQRGMPLKEYNERYLSLYLDAHRFLEWEIVQSYVEGLDSGLRHLVRHAMHCRAESRECLQEAMRLAEFYEDDPASHCPWCQASLKSEEIKTLF